jgi:pyrroloquinoline quinone (PQQ) biosynthesis protein C
LRLADPLHQVRVDRASTLLASPVKARLRREHGRDNNSKENEMDTNFVRSGPLMDPASYPAWLQDVMVECSAARRAVVEHEMLQMMSEGALSTVAMRHFLCGLWPVIEQFPQYMAMNLLKVSYGSIGQEMARRYLIRNIRVEQNHLDYWIDWAAGHGITRAELLASSRSGSIDALSHWCWHTCERDPLAVAMAATNYAIEGVTGEWTAKVCSGPYEEGFSPEVRKKAMRWLRVHADYDDTHPWEALEIIATLLGNQPAMRDVEAVQVAILKSYAYVEMAFDDCLAADGSTQLVGLPTIVTRPAVAHSAAH